MRCVQPSALSVPSSRTRLPTDEKREQCGEQERGDRRDDREREAEVVREVRGGDERAADLVGDVLRARDLRLRERRLDRRLAPRRRPCSSRRGRARRSRGPFWWASVCSCFSGRYTSALWPPSGGLTSPTTVKVVPFSGELRADLERVLRGVGRSRSSASLPPAGERKRPFVTCAVVTTPIVGCVWSTPPIVYAVVVMFVCGGFSTCVSVCCGVVKRVRSFCSDSGRHFANAPRSTPPKPPPPPPPPKPPLPPLPELRPPPFEPLPFEPLRSSSSRRSAGAACRSRPASPRTAPPSGAAMLRVMLERLRRRSSASRRSSGRRPPGARRGASARCVTWATPPSCAICFACDLLEGELRARQEEVVDEVRAGLAELREVGDDRLVRLDQVAVRRRRPGEAAAPPNRRRCSAAAAAASPSGRCRCPASGSSVFVLRLVEPVREARDGRSRARRRSRGRGS